MNKKFICLISVFMVFVLLFLNSCSSTKNWKTVEIEGYGTLKVPENWKLSIVDDFIHFSSDESGESKDVLVQYSKPGSTNEQFDDIKDFVWLVDENYSNSAGIIKYEVLYQNGTSAEMFILYFTEINNLEFSEFICVDTSVSEDILKKITKSYHMYC